MKNEIELLDNKEVYNLYNNIKELVEESRNRVYKTVNIEMINLYWNIGKMIVDIQGGNEKAKYKDYITQELSARLTTNFGKGFSKQNLERMRKFYLYHPITTTLMSQLSWSHYLECVGKNNRYGHPKEEVLEILKNSKIYRTDIDGSIEIELNKNGYKIKTCPP